MLSTVVFPTYDGPDVRFVGSWMQTGGLEGEQAIDSLRLLT